MPFFVDLSTRPADMESLVSIARLARGMGIRILGVPVELIREPLCVEGVLAVPRYLVRASTRREARVKLDNAPPTALTVLEALSADVARYASVNKRVEILRLPPQLSSLVDRSTARLFRERGWGLVELSVAGLPHEGLLGELRFLATATRRAVAFSIPFTLVSDAKEPLDLWHPRTLASLLEVAGIPWSTALSALTNYPLSIISRKRALNKALKECLEGSKSRASQPRT